MDDVLGSVGFCEQKWLWVVLPSDGGGVNKAWMNGDNIDWQSMQLHRERLCERGNRGLGGAVHRCTR